MTNNYWVISLNKEDFGEEEFEKKEDAIAHLNELVKLREFTFDNEFQEEVEKPAYGYIGQVEEYKPTIDTETLLEAIGQEAYNEFPDHAEEYLEDVSKEHIKELDININKMFSEWLETHNYMPNFCNVKNIERIKL